MYFVILGSIVGSGFMLSLIAIPGLIASPVTGLIAWWLARRRWLNGGREALAGIAYSVCLVLPWILLVVALRRGCLSSSTTNRSYLILYLAWLFGPLVTFGIVGANFQTLDSEPRPDYWWVGFSIFWGLVFLWVGSAAMTIKWWSGIKDVTVECLTGYRFIMPYALATICLWTTFGYMWVWERIVPPCTAIESTLRECIP